MEPNFKEVLDAVRVQELEEYHAVVVPEGYGVASLRGFGEKPTNQAGYIKLDTIESFTEYFAEHKEKGSVILADKDNRKFTAIFDWHSGDTKGWAEHMASYTLETTPEWDAWHGIHEQSFSQSKFADFIEENIREIHTPDGLSVLESVSHLSGKRNVQFESTRRLDNGDIGIVWKETTEASGGQKGEGRVPSQITLRLPVFKGAEKVTTYDIKAFLRYQIRDGNLSFTLKLHRAQRAFDKAFSEVSDAIQKDLKSKKVEDSAFYNGSLFRTPRCMLKDIY